MIKVAEASLVEILQKSVGNSSYEKYEVLKFSDKPIGYLADHFILRIWKNDTKSYDFFLKAAPREVQKRLEYLEETKFFYKEAQLYKKLIPELIKFSSISWAPKCYSIAEEHYIVMENLKKHKIYPSENLTFDYNHLIVSVQALASFHASSIIWEKTKGCKIPDQFGEALIEAAYPQGPEDHVRRRGLENAIEALVQLLGVIPEIRDSQFYDAVVEKFPNVIRKIYDLSATSKKYRNVFCHGDLWVNNVMFTYQKDDKPADCKFVDFQLARYAPPCLDLADLIYINTSRKFRIAMLKEVLNIYSKTLEKELKRAKCSSEMISRKEILESFKELALSGLINGALFGHVTLLPPSMGADLLSSSEEYDKFYNESRVKTCLKAFEDQNYRDRMSEILVEIVENFVLPQVRAVDDFSQK